MKWTEDEMLEMRIAGFEWTDIAEATGLTAIQSKNIVLDYIHKEIYGNDILEWSL